MGTNYPGGLDDFAGTSPTYMADDDITGRTHPERHDDVEKALEAVETELGVNPSGAATDVAARFTALDTTVSGKAPIASPTFTGTVTAPIIHSTGRIRLAVNGSNPTSPETGDLYYNDGSHHIRYYDGSGWDTLVDVEDAQTISGVKTFSANPVFNDAGIPQAKVANLTTDLAAKLASTSLGHSAVLPWSLTPNASNRTWTKTAASADYQPFGGNIQNTTSPVQNDYLEYSVALPAGTYAITVMHRASTNRGIYSVSIDGGAALASTVDGYAAATSNVTTEITGVTITGSGAHTIRLTAATKNGSSSGYTISLYAISLSKTGA